MILSIAITLLAAGTPYGHDHYVSEDGAWCWFADPRAIWFEGKILSGSVSHEGDIRADLYDPATKERKEWTLAPKFEADDHANPSFLVLPDRRVMAIFSKHTGADMFVSVFSQNAGERSWSEPRKIDPNDPDYRGPKGALNSYTYPNPQMLSGEHNRIYLFWRGMNWKPTVSFSNDFGKTWEKGRILVSPEDESPSNRPYMKVAGDGKSTIHLAFTDGHPRNEPTNSIYYVQYRNHAIRTAKGGLIADLKNLPIRPSQADVVYDGKSEGIRAWIWDVAQDAKGQPVVTYSRLPREDQHFYRYARWNGSRWVDRPIVFGGKWFPKTPVGTKEPEPHYSGGAVLDPSDPRIVYLSRPVGPRFEIERWFTPDGGDTWSHVAITGDSKHDSVRPFVIRGSRPDGTSPNALWMNSTSYVHYTNFRSTIQAANEDLGPYKPSDPLRAADAVWRWVRSNPSSNESWDWTMAPFLSGVLDYSKSRDNHDAADWVRQIGRAMNWSMGPRKSMADDVAVGQAFLQLYATDKDPAEIGPVKTWVDHFVSLSHQHSLEWKDSVQNEELAWCDSLFMAPPAMVMLSEATGDGRYAEKMAELWWKTSDYLYDPSERLFYRDSRYFGQKEANGKKVFWSRGNGWVLAGLARVLEHLPQGFAGRAKFETQFKEMAARLAALQTKDGTWHASLLDPESYPQRECSGTAFYIYAMAWGINAHVLDRKEFEPVVNRGFAALCDSIDPNGRVAWIQPVGADPRSVRYSDTDTYGVGGFLLAACEVAKMTPAQRKN